MEFSFNVIMNTYSMFIMIIIFAQLIRKTEKTDLGYRLFIAMIQTTFVLLFADILSRMSGKPETIYLYFNHIGNFIVFSLSTLLVSFWFLYVYYNIFKEESRTKEIIKIFLYINVLNLMTVILNQFTRHYYYIDKANIFHRGPLFFIYLLFVIIVIFMGLILTVKNKEKIERKYYKALILFPLPATIGIIIQTMFYQVSMSLNYMVLSILIIFLNIQNSDMYREHLTGVYNRKRLDIYLKDKIESSTKDRTFSTIMIDLNDFKEINDTFGHDMGDHALQTTASLLRSCVRLNDLISRFGGDEFYIVLDIYERHKLEEVVDRMKSCFERYNKTESQLYKLSISIGYDVYDYNTRMGVQEFQNHIDTLMYKDKQTNKKII